MSEFNKELLFKPRCPERVVDVPDLGSFRVRGMTRAEIKATSEMAGRGEDPEPFVLASCLLDPELSKDEASRWLEVAQFAEIQTLTTAINELSGIANYAAKEAYKSAGDEPGSGVRVLPGPEAVDDGGPAAGADER